METIIFDLNFLGESSQEQLDAYRKLGSVAHLKRLRQQEIRRNKLWKRTWQALKIVLLSACLLFDIWVFLSWADIAFNNSHPGAVYQAWNLFVLFS